MNYDDAVFKFLADPTRIEQAVEIADYIERLKNDMLVRFWTKLNPSLDKHLKNSDFCNQYKYRPQRTIRKGWASGDIYMPQIANDPQLAFLCFGQFGSETNYQLYLGVHWVRNSHEGFNHPSLGKLDIELITNKITMEDSWWLRRANYKYRIYDPLVLSRLYLNPDSLIEEVTNEIWDLFVAIEPYLTEVNSALRASVQSQV